MKISTPDQSFDVQQVPVKLLWWLLCCHVNYTWCFVEVKPRLKRFQNRLYILNENFKFHWYSYKVNIAKILTYEKDFWNIIAVKILLHTRRSCIFLPQNAPSQRLLHSCWNSELLLKTAKFTPTFAIVWKTEEGLNFK